MGLALEKDAEECYSVDMNDAVRHGMCVSVLASELARELGCDEEFIHKVAVAGMLHDVGKLQVSPYIYGRRQGAMKIEEMRYVRCMQACAEILKREGYDQGHKWIWCTITMKTMTARDIRTGCGARRYHSAQDLSECAMCSVHWSATDIQEGI